MIPRLALLLLGTLSACSGCSSDPARPPPADLGRRDRYVYRNDLPPPADLAPDLFKPHACGGSRVITPTLIPGQTSTPCGKGCQQVTHGDNVDYRFYDVSGDILVFTGGSAAPINGKIYYVDLKTKEEWLLRQGEKDRPGCYLAATDGQRILYGCLDWPAGSKTVITSFHAFDPKTNVETDLQCLTMNLEPMQAGFPDNLAVSAVGYATTLSQVCECPVEHVFFGTFSGSLAKITTTRNSYWDVGLAAGRVIWSEGSASYNRRLVASCAPVGACTPSFVDPQSAGSQWGARIDGGRIVWADHRNGSGDEWSPHNSDIYLYDVATGKASPVIVHPARQDSPDVGGDWVVWDDYRNNPDPITSKNQAASNIDIYGKNLATGEEVQFTDMPGVEDRARVDGGRVFYRGLDAAGKVSVFMIDLKARLGR